MKPEYPCCCFQVKGREVQQTISKSWENMDEVNIILMIVRLLMFEYGMKAADIGIITPYSAQQMLLMKEMTKVDEKIEINSVDAFQGREKEVIIFSSVRSNPENNIGFLADQRRLNVTMTRAKRCFIMVGNIMSLGTQRTWVRVGQWYSDKGLIYNGNSIVKNLNDIQRMQFVPAESAEEASEEQ